MGLRYILKLFGAILLCLNLTSYAQQTEIGTEFSPRKWTDGKNGYRGALSNVWITDYYTYVTIEIEVLKNTKEIPLIVGPNAHIMSGNKKYPFLGIVRDGKIQRYSYTRDNLGFTNLKKGDKVSYMLAFSGRILPGDTDFSLIDKNPNGYHGYSFTSYHINNPSNQYTNYSSTIAEKEAMQRVDNNNDGIHGIYESVNKDGFRIVCMKNDTGDWGMIYLDDTYNRDWWHPGDVVAMMRPTAIPGTFLGEWVGIDKMADGNCKFYFDGLAFKCERPYTTETFIKTYPTSSIGSYSAPNKSLSNIWTGTGWAILENYIVTNYHVVDGAKTIAIKGVNGNTTSSVTADIVAVDKHNDLAILRIKSTKIDGIPYSVSPSQSEVGEEIYVLGYPMTDTMGKEIKLTTGVISARTGFQGDPTNYQISAPIQPGNSGGPMFNRKGEVVGIVVAKHTEADNASYAIKTSCLQNLIESSIGKNLFPTANTISSLPLNKQVNAIKNYVYYILCSDVPNYKFEQ